jgi:hypothetical protein
MTRELPWGIPPVIPAGILDGGAAHPQGQNRDISGIRRWPSGLALQRFVAGFLFSAMALTKRDDAAIALIPSVGSGERRSWGMAVD